jgi:hypothetical protein
MTSSGEDRATDEVRQRVDEAKEQVKQGLHDAKEQVRETSRAAMEQAREARRKARDEIRARGEDFVQHQKNRCADSIEHYSAAAKRAAGQLREEHDDVLASYADNLAGTLERAAHYIRRRDLREFVETFEAYTRRHPEVVLGGVFVAGLAAARFLKAAAPPDDSDPAQYDEFEFDYAYEEFGPGDAADYEPESTEMETSPSESEEARAGMSPTER